MRARCVLRDLSSNDVLHHDIGLKDMGLDQWTCGGDARRYQKIAARNDGDASAVVSSNQLHEILPRAIVPMGNVVPDPSNLGHEGRMIDQLLVTVVAWIYDEFDVVPNLLAVVPWQAAARHRPVQSFHGVDGGWDIALLHDQGRRGRVDEGRSAAEFTEHGLHRILNKDRQAQQRHLGNVLAMLGSKRRCRRQQAR